MVNMLKKNMKQNIISGDNMKNEEEELQSDTEMNSNESSDFSDDDDKSDEDSNEEDEEEESTAGASLAGMKRERNEEDFLPPNAKRPKVMKPTRLPTAEELTYMKETTVLYHGNLFRLQMEELLKNISIKQTQRLQLLSWLTTFTKFLSAIPAADEPVELNDSSWYTSRGVQMPLTLPPKMKDNFKFAPPTDVSFTGSFMDGSITTQNCVIDLIVEVPKSCLTSHDRKDGRWLLKRAHYLAHLATALANCPALHTDGITWSLHMGEPLRPVLMVSPKLSSSSRRWRVQLLPVPSPDAIKVHAFAPYKKNIKQKGISCSEVLNFLCCVDTSMRASNAALQETLQAHQTLVDAVKLLKVWLSQRQVYKGRGSFSGHLMAQLVLLLYKIRRIGPHMSAFQVFRTVLFYIESDLNWGETGVSLHESSQKTDDSKEPVNPFANTIVPISRYHELYTLVFVDITGYINLATGLTPQLLLQLKQEAKYGQEVLNSNTFDSFEILFIQRAHFDLAFDQSLQVKVTEDCLRHYYSPDKATTLPMLLNQLHPQVFADGDESDEEDNLPPIGEVTPLQTALCQLLTKGLGQRATLVMHKIQPPQEWQLSDPLPPKQDTLVFGMKLDPTTAWVLLVKDSENKPEEFREFWGDELSELRRYHDGTFCESVMCGEATHQEGDRRKIPGFLAKHLFKRHFNIPSKKVTHLGPNVESALRLAKSSPDYDKYCTGEASCQSAVVAYDALCRILRQLKLELAVTSIASSSPVVAQSRVFTRDIIGADLTAAEQIRTMVNSTDPTEVLVFLERSGKWPNELEAVNAVRLQFHKSILQQLRRKKIISVEGNQYLYVIISGYPFKVRVSYQGEVLLLRQLASGWKTQEDESESVAVQDTTESLQLQIQTTVTPKIITALAGLGRHHTSYSSCVRLCRRWVSALMLEPHMPPLVTQLLVAHLYLQPGPFQAPHTPSVGFLRFLSLLSLTDWSITPVFIDLISDFHSEDLAYLRGRFNSVRETLPPLFLVTSFDIRGSHAVIKDADGTKNVDPSVLDYRYKLASEWSREGPTPAVLLTLKSVATAALANIDANARNNKFNVWDLFAPITSYFHITIQLSRARIPLPEEGVPVGTVSHSRPVHSTSSPLSKCRPTELVAHLKDVYRDYAFVFYDDLAGSIIGMWFKPGALDEHTIKQKERGIPGMELVSTGPTLRGQLCLDTVAATVQGLFEKLIQSVTVNNTSRQ